MIIFEFKIKGKDAQFRAIDEAIRTSQFIQFVEKQFYPTEPRSAQEAFGQSQA